MDRFGSGSCRKGCVAATLFWLLAATPSAVLAQEPQPFRRDDEIDGRDFDYSDVTFLHHFTYRPRTELQWEWIRNPSGFRATAGSIRSDEFYADLAIRRRWALDEHYFFELRSEVAEDFDGRYHHIVTGVGRHLGSGWSAAVHGELEGAKENIDASVELRWEDQLGLGRRLRIVGMAVDATYNGKNDEFAEYERSPFTTFVEGLWTTESGVSGQAWVNWNSDTRLEREADGHDFTYRRLHGGARALVPWSSWQLMLEGLGERGRTERTPFDPTTATDDDERRLSRYHLRARAELERTVNERVAVWGGYTYFRLLERDRRPRDLTLDRKILRREHTVYVGATWKISERVLLWPGLYLDFPDNREDLDFAGISDADRSMVGKIALPLEVAFANGARLTINPTVRVDEARFGGGNVQLHVPF
ncbi:MAG: hypothetical protein AB7O52_13765 [Planctomycetota bacterium]